MRRRKGRDLQEDIDIALSRSTDGGRTWEPIRVIMDMGEYGGLPQEQNGCSDPGLIVDRETGEIFCFAVWMNMRSSHENFRAVAITRDLWKSWKPHVTSHMLCFKNSDSPNCSDQLGRTLPRNRFSRIPYCLIS